MAKKTTKTGVRVAKEQLNVAEEIRKYRDEHPGAMPVEVQAALLKRGIEVSTGYISTISHIAKKRTERKTHTISTEALMQKKEFISQIGSEEEAREVLELLENLGGLRVVREAIDIIAQIKQ